MITLYAGVNLKGFIKNRSMKKSNYIEIFIKMSLALESVGKCNYIHNCICIDNFCISVSDEDVQVTLVSFGRSCPAQSTSFHSSHFNKHCAPFPSPELSRGEKCLTHASDVYSFARVLTTTFRGHRIGDITRDWADRVLLSRSPEERPKLEELIVVLNQSKQLQLQNTNDLMGSGSSSITGGIGDEKERAVQRKERKRKKATKDEAHRQSEKKEEEKDLKETIIERDLWKKQKCEESLESYVLTLKNNNITVLKPQQLCSLLETIDSKSNPLKCQLETVKMYGNLNPGKSGYVVKDFEFESRQLNKMN
ncbi:hypothetical protein Pcinc_035253 [Petrolisthes cinctipes]|uniref:Protein kinase domain-containing protein n=1 Tax=Petrolisthes cinctipes TaxID=88211 RepID=A0AAE1EN57_PETCI|nr:hypothetical protein Pcinc_035253 [Petrolisthes cinctipes]